MDRRYAFDHASRTRHQHAKHGVLEPEPKPFGAHDVVARALALGRALVAAKAPVVLATTDFAPNYADVPKRDAD